MYKVLSSTSRFCVQCNTENVRSRSGLSGVPDSGHYLGVNPNLAESNYVTRRVAGKNSRSMEYVQFSDWSSLEGGLLVEHSAGLCKASEKYYIYIGSPSICRHGSMLEGIWICHRSRLMSERG